MTSNLDLPPLDFAFNNEKYSSHSLCLTNESGKVYSTIRVTSVVLAAFSRYFDSLFTNSMKETNQREIGIEIPECDSSLFHCLIESLYSGELKLPNPESNVASEPMAVVNEGEVDIESEKEKEKEKKGKKRGRKRKSKVAKKKENEPIGESSDELDEDEDDELVRTYEDEQSILCFNMLRLVDQFSIEKRFENCVNLLTQIPRTVKTACYHIIIINEHFSHINIAAQYRQFLIKYIFSQFVDLDKKFQTNDFLILPFKMVKEILNSDDLLVTTEATILQAIRLWYMHDSSRKVYLAELLELVRYSSLEWDYIIDYLLESDLFFSEHFTWAKELNDLVQKNLINALRLRTNNSFGGKLLGGWSFPITKARKGYRKSEKSEPIDWEVDVSTPELTSPSFYFRGVYLRVQLIAQRGVQVFLLVPNMGLISGKASNKLLLVSFDFEVQAFNVRNNEYVVISDQNHRDGVTGSQLTFDADSVFVDPFSRKIKLRAFVRRRKSSRNYAL